MVMAKLHIICGNCGCNDDFKYHHGEFPSNAEETTMQYETVIVCNNCSTQHWLNDNSKNTNEIRSK